MRCAFCKAPIDPRAAWKGTSDRFYCSEFCADSETIVPASQTILKPQIDRQYVERLERLLPLRRAALS